MTAVMMTKFVDAGKNRRYLVQDTLNTEVFGMAQSLATDQFSLYHGTKSSTIATLIQTTDTRKIKPDASGCVIELSMLFRKKQPSLVQTFADFSKFSITRSWTYLLCSTDATLLRVDTLREV